MCGISGAVGRVDPVVVDAVKRMNGAQHHRGPDDEGFWSSPREQDQDLSAVFAFRRLAIIDLSPQAHQPMIDPITGNVIIFNGEIYNFRELGRELERDGVQFQSRSDTEVLLKAYERWGTQAVRRLRGMFAFAIWDAGRRVLVLARDRLGIKPLYLAGFHRPDGRAGILFASELRALLASGLVERRLNPMALSTYVWNGFVVGPQAIVEGVRLLPAGTFAILRAQSDRCEINRYWRLPVARESSDGVERLGQQLHTAVKQHLVSDVPLGVFLSGGIDSSAITALAVRAGGSRVQTFSIGFDESQYDESRYAKAVAEALGTHHTEVRLSQRIFRDQLPDALACIDQPTFDALNTYFVSRAVREAGITVALAGTGGDELFGGYRSFVDIPRAAEFSRSVSALPETVLRRLALGMARAKEGRFGEIPPQTRWGKLGDALATRGKTVDLYQAAYGLFTTDFVSNLLNDGLHEATHCGLPQLIADELDELVGSDGELHAISTLELACYIGQRLLRDTDAASMAVSLEARVPLLDHEVVEAVASIESGRRFHPLGRKRLLRELAMPELDSVLLDRPKAGFVLPIDVWCKQELTDEITEVFDDAGLCAAAGLNYAVVQRVWRAFRAGAPGLYWSRVWALFVLLWWCRTHRVSL